MNLAVLALGLIGAAVVSVCLWVQQRRAAARAMALRATGRRTSATIRSIVATGRQNTMRRVTLETADGTELVQTFSFVEADELSLEVGGGATVLVEHGNPAHGVIESLASGVQLAEPDDSARVPVLVGAFIAALAVAAAAVT
jgi:molybdopterin-binding protein